MMGAMLRSAALPGLALLYIAGSASAAPVPCTFYGINPGAPVWNGQVLLDASYAAALNASGARTVRVDFRLDGAASWDAAKLAQYDGIIDDVRAAGLEPLGLLGYEGVIGSQVDWNDDADGDGYNPYVDAFASTTEVLFNHFQGKIRRWEIWNEPDCWSNPSYASDPQHAGCTYLLPRVLAKLLAEIYVRNEALLSGGQVSLVSGGLFAHDIGGSYSPATGYLGEVYDQGVWDWLEANAGRRYPWDNLGYHLYVEQGQATDGQLMTSYLDDVRTLADSRTDPASFAITEFGWTTAGVSPSVQAANLTAAFDLFATRSDVADAYWFSYRDAPAANLYFGLTDDNGTPKEALAAMQAVSADCIPEQGGGGAGGQGAGDAGQGGQGGEAGAASGGHGAGPGTGGQGASGASGSAVVADDASEGGCGCRLAAAAGPRGSIATVLGLLGLGALRRRRSARSAPFSPSGPAVARHPCAGSVRGLARRRGDRPCRG